MEATRQTVKTHSYSIPEGQVFAGRHQNRKRILTASMLILQGDQQVSDVGHGVGFVDLGRFYKQFRKTMNVTPSQFRFEKNH